jgi:hypothetical protein
MIALREATLSDRDAILALRARCFPVDDPEKRESRFWDWEFRHGRFFVAEEHGRVIAHLGFVGQTYVVDGVRTPSLLAVDAMSDPEYRGRRLFGQVASYAAQLLAQDVAFSGAWQIRKAVAGGMHGAGWEAVDGARVLIRPFTTAFGGDGAPTSDVEMMAAVARDFYVDAFVERTPEWLRWRYFENPLWRYDATATAEAWLVTRRTRLKGIDTLAIVDVAWRRGGSREARSLLARALRSARTTLAATLVTRAHPAYGWFLRRGFVPGPHRFRFLVNDFRAMASQSQRSTRDADRGAPAARPRWALLWGDTDHL